MTMRIARLDLLRYGHFTDRTLSFPKSPFDIHIVYGPNEAGKTTTRFALEDFLFGIPAQSPMNFTHDYRSMRVGATLETAESSFSAIRKKGNKKTILDDDENASPTLEKALFSVLGGVDRPVYQRMFSMDRERLKEGGQELVLTGGEINQALFSAGTGISGVQEQLASLENGADSLWSSRRAQHREFYKSLDKYKNAEAEIREFTCRAATWKSARDALDSARKRLEGANQRIEKLLSEQSRMSRIRRVYPVILDVHKIQQSIQDLGDVRPLPDDASDKVIQLLKLESECGAKKATLSEQLAASRTELGALTIDDRVLHLASEIHELLKQHSAIKKSRTDLPRRKAELDAIEEGFQLKTRELGWSDLEPDEIVKRIPTKIDTQKVHSLASEHRAICSTLEAKRQAHEEAAQRVDDAQQRAGGIGTGADVTTLKTLVSSAEHDVDLDRALLETREALAASDAQIELLMSRLHPSVQDEQALAAITAPPKNSIQKHRDDMHALEERIRALSESRDEAQRKYSRFQHKAESIEKASSAVSAEKLQTARARRNDLWSIVDHQFIEGREVPSDLLETYQSDIAELPKAFEEAIATADELADRRFDNVDAANKLANLLDQAEEQNMDIEQANDELEACLLQRRELDANWASLWEGAPFSPLDPDHMLDWLGVRDQLANETQTRIKLTQMLKLREKECESTKHSLLSEMRALGEETEPFEAKPIRVALQRANEIIRRAELELIARDKAEEDVNRAVSDVEKHEAALLAAEQDLERWKTQWGDAVSAVGLEHYLEPKQALLCLEVFDELRNSASEREKLKKDRILKIEQDLAEFDSRVQAATKQCGVKDGKLDPDVAMVELEQRLRDAEATNQRHNDLTARIEKLENSVKQLDSELSEATKSLDYLHKIAGTQTINDLRGAVERSDEFKRLQQAVDKRTQELLEQGDGLGVTELEAECDGVDLDTVRSREKMLAEELTELRSELQELSAEHHDAKLRFQEIGGADHAARAEASRQEAIAELEGIASQYIRLRTASMLLRWAIDRFRGEKQAPLLKRAGELFSAATKGSFAGLTVDEDDGGKLQLMATRPDGPVVAISGMSTGSADQLYLSLRVAALEEYMEVGATLPFVADDLFVNFDDDRAGAGLSLLSELSTHTQVIFFTHHQRTVELARDVLGKDASILSLG